MVNEYKISNRYSIGGLKPIVYLLPVNDTTINYRVGENECEVENISSYNIIKINGRNSIFNEELSYNTRFNFTSTFTITITERYGSIYSDILNDLRYGKYYVVFEDMMGVQYIQTPEFYSRLSWNYNFVSTSDNNSCSLSFKVDSNIPSVALKENISETIVLIEKDCGYKIGRCFNLRLIPNNYCYFRYDSDSKVISEIFTTGGEEFKQIDFIPTTFSCNRTYENDEFNDTLSFTIPLSDYKYYFHYSLEEFKNNRYVALFDTTIGDTVLLGWEFGLFPSYTIQTSEDNSNNTITFTLTQKSQFYLVYKASGGVTITKDEQLLKSPINDLYDPVTGTMLPTEVCVNETQAIYTILAATTIDGTKVGKYYVLDGYQDLYANLNVIGTYAATDNVGLKLTHNSEKCSVQNKCVWNKGLPSIIEFNTPQSKTFVVNSECDWVLQNIPTWLDVNVRSGSAGEDVTITFTPNIEPPVNTLTSELRLSNGVNTTGGSAIYYKSSGLITPSYANITAQGQIVYFYTDKNVTFTTSDLDWATVTNLGDGTIKVVVSENYDELNSRSGVITFSSGDESVDVPIVQDKRYTAWIDLDGYICNNGNSYTKQGKYYGYTPDNIVYSTGEVRANNLIYSNDSRCTSTQTKWEVMLNETICEGNTLYRVEAEYSSTDGGATWVFTGQTRRGTAIEYNSEKCSDNITWKIVEGSYYCEEDLNGNKYVVYPAGSTDLYTVNNGFSFNKQFTLNGQDYYLISGSGSSFRFGNENSWEDNTSLISAGYLDVSNITSMDYMFYGCTTVEHLNLSTWTTSQITSLYNMFQNCTSLETLDLSNWNIQQGVTSIGNIFANCTSLETIYMYNASDWTYTLISEGLISAQLQDKVTIIR